MRRKPRQGMRLRLRGRKPGGVVGELPDQLSHIRPRGERPLNVVFNYNGHSWDAYEVLGLAAGSSPDKVECAYHVALAAVTPESRAFLQAAYGAIQSEWSVFRRTGEG